MSNERRWIKVPGRGQMRGEGEWLRIDDAGCPPEDWQWNREHGYLPTHEGDEPPSGQQVDAMSDGTGSTG